MTAANKEDPRLSAIREEKEQALSALDSTYQGMIDDADKFYQDQIDAAAEWAETQTQRQQEETDLTIDKIEQDKDKAEKDYLKEQTGAYVDYAKQTNAYGVSAERIAGAGLTNTGYSESSKVSMYNTYQNRVAAAREVYNSALLNYNNSIREAQIQNSSALAEIAFKALDTQLSLSREGFIYKNELISEHTDRRMETDNEYYNRYSDTQGLIQDEKELLEDQRQFDRNMELEEKKFEEDKKQFMRDYNLRLANFNEDIRQFNLNFDESMRQFDLEMDRLLKNDAVNNAQKLGELAIKKQQLLDSRAEFAVNTTLKKQELEEEKRQFDAKQTQATLKDTQPSTKKPEAQQTPTLRDTAKTGYESTVQLLDGMKKSGSSRVAMMQEILKAHRDGRITLEQAQALRRLYGIQQ